MLEKLLLAVTITFCLNLLLGADLASTTQTASSSHDLAFEANTIGKAAARSEFGPELTAFTR